jgi:cytochrome c
MYLKINKSLIIFPALLFMVMAALSFGQEKVLSCREDPDGKFRRVKLLHPDEKVNVPQELAVAPSGRIFYIQRDGELKILQPGEDLPELAGIIPSHFDIQDGLLGLTLDPGFETSNHWIYLYYTPKDDGEESRLSRFTMDGDEINMQSEKILLTVPTYRPYAVHLGGSLVFDSKGILYLSTGDNVRDRSGFGSYHGYDWSACGDAQRTSANSNTFLGKILRIRPEDGGTYTVPEGNLFPPGMEKTLPEIFMMGTRNPFRIAIDSRNDWIYWGDVGPDAPHADPNQGPAGVDEIHLTKGPGNAGWPYFIADNKPYVKDGKAFDVEAPVNTSHENTGLRELPEPLEAIFWYTYDGHHEYTGWNGTRSICVGPLYRFDSTRQSEIMVPRRYDNALFVYEWCQQWIKVMKLSKEGEVLDVEPFDAENGISTKTIDMEMGPDGALYALEWGDVPYTSNFNQRQGTLVRYEYPHTCEEVIVNPIVRTAASRRKILSSRLFLSDMVPEVTVPKGASKALLFNTRGKIVWEKHGLRGGQMVNISVPGQLRDQLVLVGFE